MESSKKRWRLNLFDVVILLLVVLVVAAVFFLKNRSSQDFGVESKPMQYTVELWEVPEDVVNRLEPEMKLYYSTDGSYLGTLAEWRYVPYQKTAYSQTLQKYVSYPCPGKYFLYLTIRGNGYVTEKDVMIEGRSVKVGDSLYVKGKGFAGSGYVIAAEMDSPQTSAEAMPGELRFVYEYSVSDVRQFHREALHEGDRLFIADTGAEIGTITGIRTEPCVLTELGADGQPVQVEKEDRYTLTLTVEARGTETETGYFLGGLTELKVGSTLATVTYSDRLNGVITGLSTVEPVSAS